MTGILAICAVTALVVAWRRVFAGEDLTVVILILAIPGGLIPNSILIIYLKGTVAIVNRS